MGQVKKKKKKKVDYDTSSSSEEEPGDMSPQADSSGGEDFIDVEQPPLEGDVNVAELQKGDFVLVALKNDKNKKVYYVAQVETPKEGSSDCSVIYLKKSLKHRHGFVFPTAIQPYPVADEEIEMVLKPLTSGGTKRQNSILTFEINFDNLDIR